MILDRQRWLPLLALSASLPWLSVASAQQAVNQVIGQGEQRSDEAAASQDQIDGLAEQAQDIVDDYRSEMRTVEGLRVFNDILQKQVDGQLREVATLQQSIDNVGIIQRQIVPLMLNMLAGLGEFIENDLPFQLEERRERVRRLVELMEFPDVSTAEKFRYVMEAFEIENNFGRTILTYKDTIQIDGQPREVDILKIGRVALLYQSYDGTASGVWDQENRRWVSLSAEEYRNPINRGLRLANEEIAPELLMLPVPTPKEVSR